MNFLLKLVFAAGLVSPVVAASNDESRVSPLGTENVIRNPYAAANEPFTIATDSTKRVAATNAAAVMCGGVKWTHGEFLGRTNDGRPVYTHVVENRVYLNWDGTIANNVDIIYNLQGTRFPHNSTNEPIIKGCLNMPDPSTAAVNLLGRSGDKITCNGHVMDNGDLLGVFVDNGASTFQYTKYVDGKLYVMIKQGINDERTTNYNYSLMPETIEKRHGSYMDPKWDGKFTLQMLNSCYWPGNSKTGTIVSDNTCDSGPTVSGITNISQTALRFTFTGNNIGRVKWRIESGDTEVRSGTTGDLNGGKTVNINFNSLSPGNYSLEVEGESCSSGISRRDFTIGGPVTPDCDSGPALSDISEISQTGLRFAFTGNGISTVKWRIETGDTELRSGTTGDLGGGKAANLNFNSLNPGNYSLEIEGNSCKSSISRRDFRINEPVVTDPNCDSGPALSGISNITQTALRFAFTGNGISTVKWRIETGDTELRSGTTGDLNGSKAANINFNSLNPGNYSLEIEGNSCKSSISRRDFTINEPVVTIPDCQNGPSVSSLSSITPQSLTVNFGGDNLRTFSWRILQGSYAVATGETGKLGGNSAPLTFNYLKNGTYTFEMKALDCKAPAVATRSFSVSATDTRTSCTKGPTIQSLISTSDSKVEFLFDGEDVYAIDWKIMNDQNRAVRQNRLAPQNNHPVAEYSKLPNGVYTMQIQGGLCKSTTSAERFSVGVPLPIYISNFKGDVVEKGVELSWEVVAEQDGKEFEVLRYDDKLKNEEVLGTVSLTDQRTGWYKFVDESPLLGINYYQLKQIDADGTFTKSKIISVNPGIILGTVVAPNPAQDYVDIQFSSRSAGNTEVLIYNAAGVAVGSSPIKISEGKNVHRVNVKRLVNGSYFMKIQHAGELSSLRFTKMD
ncbi:T9SS type A sorting domain-containing protein [Dyadobacter sp. CY343]|uniref:T9SS type A sorting domain-containing protein n=1 Tax=Dyadobacter sp. CY343 TaxID=2907299 RepID=UPI001F259140|nr:T9SS type A sorting domain-containing protein [Dyadobacter sp. CY343]MCE7061226.1 T9SS type A sorting domain-containing protein [Dyadobacter sp. CY343]